MNNAAFINAAALVGRILVALIFPLAGFLKLGTFTGTAGYIGSKGLPVPEVLAALTIALELAGGILLVVGYKTRYVALIYFLWLIPTTLIFHRFWGIAPAQVLDQYLNFLKNVSIMGAMAMLMAFGPGAYSVDRK